jgi:hypothetical protein
MAFSQGLYFVQGGTPGISPPSANDPQLLVGGQGALSIIGLPENTRRRDPSGSVSAAVWFPVTVLGSSNGWPVGWSGSVCTLWRCQPCRLTAMLDRQPQRRLFRRPAQRVVERCQGQATPKGYFQMCGVTPPSSATCRMAPVAVGSASSLMHQARNTELSITIAVRIGRR